jgi:serine/threonine protein kinase
MALAPGTRLGPYEIVAAVGAGGMGEVYRGRDTRLDRTVAIKVLPDSVAGDPDRPEVYVRPFDPAAPSAPQGAIPVSKDGGVLPRWRHDGKELVFQSPTGALMSVEVSAGATFRPSVPRQLFVPSLPGVWDMSRDGQKFLVPIPTDTTGNAPITVVMNWTSGLAR